MSHRLLVIDDNPGYRTLVRYALAGSEVEIVGEAPNAAAGIVEAARLVPDLILLDIVMEGADGLQALQPLRESAPGAIVVTVSSYGEHEFWGRSPALQNVAYLSKGLPPSQLASELLRILHASRAAAREVLERLSEHFDADLRSAGGARRFVAATLRGWGCSDLVDSVSLLVSELVTNAVVHAHSEVELVVHLQRDRVRVEVIDAADEVVHRRDASSEAQSGRGMALIEALATSWGIDTLLAGKSIWFEVPRTPTEPV